MSGTLSYGLQLDGQPVLGKMSRISRNSVGLRVYEKESWIADCSSK
jgi:hypothetical protein